MPRYTVAALTAVLLWGPDSALAQAPDDEPSPAPPAEQNVGPATPAPTLTPEQEAEARAHFDRGRALFEGGDPGGALAEFQAAYDLSRRPTVLYNLGVAHQALHHYVEAARAIEQYLREVNLPPDRRSQVEQGLSEIRNFIGHVRFEGLPPGATVTIDGVRVGQSPFDAPIAVGTGQHTVEVSADGYHDAREALLIAGGQERTLRLQLRSMSAAQSGMPAVTGGMVLIQGAPAGAVARIDGRAVAIGRPIQFSGGEHRVRVSASGFVPWEGRVTVEAGSTRVVTVRLAEANKWGPLPLLVGAGATVALGIGTTVAGAVTLGTYNEFTSLTRDNPRAVELQEAGVAQRTVTNVLLVGTVLAGAATAVIFTRTRFGTARSTVDVAVGPRPGGAEGAVQIRF